MGRPANIPTQRQIAEALGIDPALVSRYKRLGMPVDSIRAALEWRFRNIGARTRPSTNHGQHALSFEAAHARREAAEAARAALRLGEEEGSLVRIDAVMADLATACVSFREALMQIPARVAVVAASESDPERVRDLLTGEFAKALAILADAQTALQRRNLMHFAPGATHPTAPLPAPSSDPRNPDHESF